MGFENKSISAEGDNSHEIAEPNIEDLEEAQEWIDNMFENGVRPVVTVPSVYRKSLQRGLSAHASWISGTEILVGTFGRPPYLPEGEERIEVVVVDIAKEQIKPRFTGPNSTFRGVVVLKGPISPEKLTVH